MKPPVKMAPMVEPSPVDSTARISKPVILGLAVLIRRKGKSGKLRKLTDATIYYVQGPSVLPPSRQKESGAHEVLCAVMIALVALRGRPVAGPVTAMPGFESRIFAHER